MNLHLTSLLKSCVLHCMIIILVILFGRSVLQTQGDIMIVDFTLNNLPGSSGTDVVVTAPKIKPVQDKTLQDPASNSTIKKEAPVLISNDEINSSPSPSPFLEEKAEEIVPTESRHQLFPGSRLSKATPVPSDSQFLSSQKNQDSLAYLANPAGTSSSDYTGGTGYIRDHFADIRDLIQRNVTYPLSARKRGWEGKVSVSFVISPEGKASNVKITQSSGKAVLDKCALDAVWKASPFPPPPVHAMIRIPIIYRLQDQ